MEQEKKELLLRALRSYRHWISRLEAAKLELEELEYLTSVDYSKPNVQVTGTSSPTETLARRLEELEWEVEQLPKVIKLINCAFDALSVRQRNVLERRFVLGYQPVEIMNALDMDKKQYYRIYTSAIRDMCKVIGDVGFVIFDHFFKRKRAA